MTKTIRVNEYYDLFDVKTKRANGPLEPATEGSNTNTNIPNSIKPNNEYNAFRGFNNFPITDSSSSIQPYKDSNNNVNSQYVEIAGKYKSPQATSSIKVDDNGDIWCYPPNVSVPYWSRIIFRNFDYKINETSSTKARLVPDKKSYYLNSISYVEPWAPSINEFIPRIVEVEITASDAARQWETPSGTKPSAGTVIECILWGKNTSIYKTGTPSNYPDNFPEKYKNQDFTNVNGWKDDFDISGSSSDYTNSPLFLRFDEYQSRSKVIFSSCDKTRNPDIEFSFSYHKGQMEPIKLNLSLSANIPYTDIDNSQLFNANLNKKEIESMLKACYWCIEWICDKDSGN